MYFDNNKNYFAFHFAFCLLTESKFYNPSCKFVRNILAAPWGERGWEGGK